MQNVNTTHNPYQQQSQNYTQSAAATGQNYSQNLFANYPYSTAHLLDPFTQQQQHQQQQQSQNPYTTQGTLQSHPYTGGFTRYHSNPTLYHPTYYSSTTSADHLQNQPYGSSYQTTATNPYYNPSRYYPTLPNPYPNFAAYYRGLPTVPGSSGQLAGGYSVGANFGAGTGFHSGAPSPFPGQYSSAYQTYQTSQLPPTTYYSSTYPTTTRALAQHFAANLQQGTAWPPSSVSPFAYQYPFGASGAYGSSGYLPGSTGTLTGGLGLGAYGGLGSGFHGSLPLPPLLQHRRNMVAVEMEAHERKIVEEFALLLEKSRQLFNGLRDLPQYGHKQWQPYFGRTFDAFSRLWKLQQTQRQVLDTKYGLRRWQIGEIASKIGQLYYHYYLRTSETNYLKLSQEFYSAIRTRGYYSKATKEERADLMVKKLRYYARFIVVCLLLKKMKLVRDLVRELDKQIQDYITIYEPDDQLEWSMVLNEIRAFIEADSLVTVVDLDGVPVVISHRLSPLNVPPLENIAPAVTWKLSEVIICGNCSNQIKFSELSLDMFRILQVVEREPLDEYAQVVLNASPVPLGSLEANAQAAAAAAQAATVTTAAGVSMGPAGTMGPGGDPNKRAGDAAAAKALLRENSPHKYLLFRPSFSQFYAFLSSAFKDLPAHGVLLLYLSCDGSFESIKTPPDDFGYDLGGVATNIKREPLDLQKKKALQSSLTAAGHRMGMGIGVGVKEDQCIHPGDLYPFLRKACLLIVDSDNSASFGCLPRLFGQPLLVLMSSSAEYPAPFHDTQKGSLFTLFLYSPLTAICSICNIIELPLHLWDKGMTIIDQFLAEAGRLLVNCTQLDPTYMAYYMDDFLRLILLRFIFCSLALRMHRLFRAGTAFPHAHPPLPELELFSNLTLRQLVLDLAVALDVHSLFAEPMAVHGVGGGLIDPATGQYIPTAHEQQIAANVAVLQQQQQFQAQAAQQQNMMMQHAMGMGMDPAAGVVVGPPYT